MSKEPGSILWWFCLSLWLPFLQPLRLPAKLLGHLKQHVIVKCQRKDVKNLSLKGFLTHAGNHSVMGSFQQITKISIWPDSWVRKQHGKKTKWSNSFWTPFIIISKDQSTITLKLGPGNSPKKTKLNVDIWAFNIYKTWFWALRSYW